MMLTAKVDQARAHQKLMWLGYGDVAYPPLRALFDTSVREYNEGANWTAKAVQASGDDQLLCYARAATAYTRSQCHSQQVYDSIVKPATTPSALGLRPYKAIEYSPVTP